MFTHQVSVATNMHNDYFEQNTSSYIHVGPRAISRDQSVSFIINSKQRDQVYSWEAAGIRIISSLTVH